MRANGFKHSEEYVNNIRQLTLEGKTAREIGELLGVSRNSIIGIWHRNDITPPNKRFPRGPRQAHLGVKTRGLQARSIIAKAAPSQVMPVEPVKYRVRVELLPDVEMACLILELNSRKCHFPLWGAGRPAPATALYCGAPCEETWCKEHADQVFQPFVKRVPDASRTAVYTPAKVPASST